MAPFMVATGYYELKKTFFIHINKGYLIKIFS